MLPESLKKSSQIKKKTYIKGLPKVKNVYIKALKIMLKPSLESFFTILEK